MTKETFENVLKIGENVCVEFKRGGNGAQNDTFETICAFLNRFGGDIFLGVTDDGKVVGVPEGEVEPIVNHNFFHQIPDWPCRRIGIWRAQPVPLCETLFWRDPVIRRRRRV